MESIIMASDDDLRELGLTAGEISRYKQQLSVSCKLRRSRYNHRGEAHIGEASHPGPWPFCGYKQRIFPSCQGGCSALLKILFIYTAVFSVCDGIGCAAQALQNAGAVDIDRYIAIEMEQKARQIAQFANPVTKTFPGIYHSVCSQHV